MWRGELACRTGFTRSKSITVHAAVGPTTVPIQGGGAGRERKKAQIFNLINIINRLNRLREEFFFILLPSFSHIFCYQLFLKLRILFILVDISSFFLFYFSIIYFFYLPFFSFFNSFYNIEIVLEI